MPRRAAGGFAGLTSGTLGPNLAFTPESGFGHGSTEPWLQQEANLTAQGLTPQQVTQAMMGQASPTALNAGSPSSSPTTLPQTPRPPLPTMSPFGGFGTPTFSGAPYGFPSFGGAFPFMGGFYGGGGYGGSAFARPGYFSLPMSSFSAGNPGMLGPSWAPTMPLSGTPLPTPPKGAPAGGIAYWSNPSTGAGYIQQPNGIWTDYNGAPVPPNSILPQNPAPPVKVTPSPLAAPAASAAAAVPATSAPAALPAGVNPSLPANLGGGDISSNEGYAGGGVVRGHGHSGMGASGFPSLGSPPKRADGGIGVAPDPEQLGMFDMRRSMYGMGAYHPGGFINSPVAGRTDHLPLALPVDSHVIPADVVSGIGQGNSLAGATLLDRIFHAGPWGARAAKVGDARPRTERAREPTTPILAAGGEYVVRPEAVLRLGEAAKHRDPARGAAKSPKELGHDLIDDFILRARKHVIVTTRKLPGPVRS